MLEAKYQKKLATKFWKLYKVNLRKNRLSISETTRPHYSFETGSIFQRDAPWWGQTSHILSEILVRIVERKQNY